MEEEKELRRSFNASFTVEDSELKAEISDAQEKLSAEQIIYQFLEDERYAILSQISHVRRTS